MRPPAQCVHGDTLAGRRTWRAHETIADSSADAVSYPVTIQLTGGEQTGLMIGMNAVAALANTQTLAAERGVMPMGLGG